LALMF